MKNIKRTLLLSFVMILSGSIFLLSVVIYFFLNDILREFYVLVLLIGTILFVSFYLYKKVIDKLITDVEELKNYLDDINNKNYDSIIKINTFQEFLQISLVLKNIVKRLNQKDKKSLKK